MKQPHKYSYFTSSTKSGKLIGALGDKKDIIRVTDIFVKESPYYDLEDPIIIEEVFFS